MQADKDLRVYKMDSDIGSVLHNIINVFNSDTKRKQCWGLNPKEECWVSIRLQGDDLVLKVEGLRGGWRRSVEHAVEMERYLSEVRDALKKAESDLRSEFKEATGKSLRWSKGKEWSNFEPMAPNGLYRFYACKSGPVRVKLDGQKWVEKGPDINTGDFGDDAAGLLDLISLPERWR